MQRISKYFDTSAVCNPHPKGTGKEKPLSINPEMTQTFKSRSVEWVDFVIYWSIALIPFCISISPAPANILMGFLIAAFLIKKILQREAIVSRTGISIPLLFLFIITCVSVINSINYKDSIKGGIFRLMQYAFVFFIMVGEIKNRRHIHRIVFFIAMGVVLVSIDGIWQVVAGRDFIRGYATIVNIGLLRATASFKDANLLGIYLSAFSPLLFGLTIYSKSKRKIALICLSAIALTGIMITYSRPTLLAIYIALFFLSIARKNKVIITVLIIATLISPFILPKSVKMFAKQVAYNPLRFMCNDDRIAVYRNSINMIKAHPFIGMGANTFMKNYKKYKESPEYRNIITLDYMYAHNNFFQMAAEIGLIGLSIFIWMLYRLFMECRNIYRALSDNYLKMVSLSLSACLISFLINGLTESSLYYSRLAIIFWYICGLSLSLKKFTPPFFES